MWKMIVAAFAIVAALAGCESSSEEKPIADTTGIVSSVPGGSYSGGDSSYGSHGSHGAGGYGTMAGAAKLAPGAQRVEREIVAAGDTVYFSFDSYTLDATAQATLDRQASILTKNAGIDVTIEGHCDERGTREYNLALGERRATSVKDYLVAFGINPSRIRTISYGKERPVAIGSADDALTRNRRGVTVVTGGSAGS